MFAELGIDLIQKYENDFYYWELVTLKKNEFGEGFHVKDYQGYNPLHWCYQKIADSEQILGERIKYTIGHEIKPSFNDKNYKNIEDIFKLGIFESYLKELINIAQSNLNK
jgi:hypothetical protein